MKLSLFFSYFFLFFFLFSSVLFSFPASRRGRRVRCHEASRAARIARGRHRRRDLARRQRLDRPADRVLVDHHAAVRLDAYTARASGRQIS